MTLPQPNLLLSSYTKDSNELKIKRFQWGNNLLSTPPSEACTTPRFCLTFLPVKKNERALPIEHSFLPPNSWAKWGNGSFWKGICGPSAMTCWCLAMSPESQNFLSHIKQMAFAPLGQGSAISNQQCFLVSTCASPFVQIRGDFTPEAVRAQGYTVATFLHLLSMCRSSKHWIS